MNQQQRNTSRHDAGNAAHLPQRFRLLRVELLPRLDGKRRDLHIIQIARQAQVFVMRGAGDFVFLAVDVAAVFGGNFQLLDGADIQIGVLRWRRSLRQRHQTGVRDFRATQQIEQVVLVLDELAQHTLSIGFFQGFWNGFTRNSTILQIQKRFIS